VCKLDQGVQTSHAAVWRDRPPPPQDATSTGAA
jgi:hypothetical protein